MFRLLFFKGSHLDRWELFEASSDMDALEEAASRPSQDPVELWSDGGGRIAIFRPVGTQKH